MTYRMKGSPMQRNFGIGSPLKNGQKTKRKLKPHGPHPEHDQDGDGVPDIVQVDGKKVDVEKPQKEGDSKKVKKRKLEMKKSEPVESQREKKKKIIQMPNPNVRPPGYGLDR